MKDVESLLLDAANGTEIQEIPDSARQYFHGKIDFGRLEVHLKMLPEVFKTASSHSASDIPIQKVTNVRTIADTLSKSEIYRGMVSQVDLLVRAYLTFQSLAPQLKELSPPFVD